MNDLLLVTEEKAIDVFNDRNSLDFLLSEIEKEAWDFTPDPTTKKGRDEIGSRARKVSSSKVVIDNARKKLVADMKAKTKAIDASGKVARDFLDELRDNILDHRKAWEEEQARLAEEKRLQDELEAAETEAYALHDLWLREQAIKEQEEKLEAERLEREQKAEQERLEQERKERDERIRKEAAEKAEREAREAVERAEREAQEAKEREKQAAIKAENDRKEAERLAKERAEKAAEDARLKAEREAAEKEAERLRLEQARKDEDERRARDKAHKRTVNRAIVAAFGENGIDEPTAQKIVKLVLSKSIPNMFLNY